MRADYSFESRWAVPAPPGRCWREIERTVTGASGAWWPGVRVERPASALTPGASVVLAVRAPLGYRLRCTLRITAIESDSSLDADSSGDLVGHGAIRIRPTGDGSAIEIRWDVTVQRAWMRMLSPVLRPVFAAAHGMVMRMGERGLRRAVKGGASGIRNPANPDR
ncbi:hypothetical protein [Microbacterium sp. JZ31]|uniref:hypothetical protein n=1 Tax=Microbacterium sp. JZ31 TaxID=1906274 RepID=UPI00193159A7|nr:hypothetical protein [Microbacterium sp. JZ31]